MQQNVQCKPFEHVHGHVARLKIDHAAMGSFKQGADQPAWLHDLFSSRRIRHFS